MITVIDYGMGNLSSVANAIKRYTEDVQISFNPKDITRADKVVLPGVGAFKDAYDEIKRRRFLEPILDFIHSGKPFMGICLGLQLLFTKSYEGGEHPGLDIIKGEVIPFSKNRDLKIPHMGWNAITQNSILRLRSGLMVSEAEPSKLKTQNCPLLKGVPDGAYMYFVHSYYAVPAKKDGVVTTTDYGVEFCSFLWKDNIYAMQFHPEKSQQMGLRIIKNFVKL